MAKIYKTRAKDRGPFNVWLKVGEIKINGTTFFKRLSVSRKKNKVK